MGVDNAFIEVEGPELPAMDGSALPFARAVAASGLVEQRRARSVGAVRREILMREGGATLAARPVEGRRLKVTYTLHYEASRLARGTRTFDVTPETFLSEIAPARTFCMAGEVERLRASGLGKGALGENTLVLAEDECIGNELRMPLEPLRHKVLDMLGDMALVGFRLSAHLVGVKSGHALNRRMALELRAAASSEVSRSDTGTGVAR
jgi:UDP-3-O-acyl-N-acetylglucosamine deacetylase